MILKNNLVLKFLIFLWIFFTQIHTLHAFGIIRDDEIESTIESIINPVLKAASIPVGSVNIYILDDPSINAFVLGGQNIFIHTGLIEFSNNPEVLIGVLAHELGHVVGGHIIAQKENIEFLKKKMFLNMAAGFLAAKSSNSTDIGFGTFIGLSESDKRMFLKYTRQQESEADSAALRYLDRIGISSDGLLELLQHLSHQDHIFHSDMDPYLSTHPVSKERISTIKSSHSNKKNSLVSAALRHRYSRIVAKISAWTSNEPLKTINQFTGTEPTSLYARSICNFRLNNLKAAKDELRNAILEEPKNPYFYEQLAQYYFESGDLKNALENYEVAHRLSAKTVTIALGYAHTLISIKSDMNQAIKVLEFVQSKEPYNVLAWRLLGMAYKQNQDETNSALAFAQEAALKGDLSTAKKYLKLAGKTNLSSKQRLRLTDIESSIEKPTYD